MTTIIMTGCVVNDPKVRNVKTAHGMAQLIQFELTDGDNDITIPVVAFGNHGKDVRSFLKAGMMVVAHGQMRKNSYTKRYEMVADDIRLTMTRKQYAEATINAVVKKDAPDYGFGAQESNNNDYYDEEPLEDSPF